MKNLIVYYSYEGNCDEIANAIKEVTDADVLKLLPKKEKKTKSLFRFVWGGMQVYMTKKTELEPYEIDLSKYDNIFKRNTYKNFEEVLQGNNIVDKQEFVYPIKNGIEKAKIEAKEWATKCLKK